MKNLNNLAVGDSVIHLSSGRTRTNPNGQRTRLTVLKVGRTLIHCELWSRSIAFRKDSGIINDGRGGSRIVTDDMLADEDERRELKTQLRSHGIEFTRRHLTTEKLRKILAVLNQDEGRAMTTPTPAEAEELSDIVSRIRSPWDGERIVSTFWTPTVVTAILAAGYLSPEQVAAKVREAQAEAWDEGATAATKGKSGERWLNNPYRADQIGSGS